MRRRVTKNQQETVIKNRPERKFFYPCGEDGSKAGRASRFFAPSDLPSYLLSSTSMPRRHILLFGFRSRLQPREASMRKKISLRRHEANKKEVFDMTGNRFEESWRQSLPPDEYMRYVEAAKREAKCRACGAPIPKGTKHSCFRFQDNLWRRSFRLCNVCLDKIMGEAKSKERKPAQGNEATRPEAGREVPSLINVAVPSAESFDSLRSEVIAHREERATARAREGGRERDAEMALLMDARDSLIRELRMSQIIMECQEAAITSYRDFLSKTKGRKAFESDKEVMI